MEIRGNVTLVGGYPYSFLLFQTENRTNRTGSDATKCRMQSDTTWSAVAHTCIAWSTLAVAKSFLTDSFLPGSYYQTVVFRCRELSMLAREARASLVRP